MKHSLLLFSSVLLFLGCEHHDAISQPNKSCDLISWQRTLPPHTERTNEILPPPLRDTSIIVNGTSRKLSLPAGFTISVYSTMPHARWMTFSPDSVLYITSYDGSVYALPDHNHDGVPDSTITIASGFSNPSGIGFYHGDLYISDQTGFYHMANRNGDRQAEAREILMRFPGGGHISRCFMIDTVRGKVYVQVGAPTNDAELSVADSERATILEANIDGTGRRIFARGLRNAVGLDFDPRTGALWANNNGMDDMFADRQHTDNNPSECVYIICDGANYGWPYAYGYQMRHPRLYQNKDTAFFQTLSGPVAEVLAHEAPLALHFYRGHQFPANYHNAIFQTYHGSWDRSVPAPPRVTVLWADSDGRNARVMDFINGFQPDSSGSRWGRVTGITEAPDGSLYISDDGPDGKLVGEIYHVVYTGATNAVNPTPQRERAEILSISPNPAHSVVHAEVTLPTSRSVAYEIVDMLGRVVQSASTNPLARGDQTIEIPLNTLSAGSYILRVIGHDDVVSKAFVVE